MSTWEIMDKIRELILPDDFVFLRLLKSAGEVYRFEGELESKAISRSCLTRLDNALIRMETSGHEFRLRAADAKLPYPTRTEWETFFRESKSMNETKPGERADTIHIEGLPTRWFQVKIFLVHFFSIFCVEFIGKTKSDASCSSCCCSDWSKWFTIFISNFDN
jgi:arginine/serine-rich splicing factor 17